MESLVYTPTYELFLVLEPLRRNFRNLCEAVEQLTETDAPDLLGADIYYRATTDVALLGLRFDERSLTYKELTWVLDYAAGAGIPVLDPSKLGETDRRQFYRSYLASYQTRLEDLPGATEALYELGRRLRLVKNTRARTHGEGPKQIPSRKQRRMATKEMFGAPASQPLRTPSAIASAPQPSGDAPLRASIPSGVSPRGKLGPSHHSTDQRQDYSLVEQAALAQGAAAQRAATVRTPLADDDRTARDLHPLHVVDEETHKVARGKGKKRRRRGETLPETPAARRPASQPNPQQAASNGVPDQEHGADGSGPVHEPDIEVRYRRGGQWTMARLRSLSSKGAYLVTGALPRLGDTVSLAFAYNNAGVTVEAKVYHITSVRDANETGSTGFAVRFPYQASPERDKLIDILKKALANGVRIKPPPSRETVRFPVFWPIRVGASTGGVQVDALDVSVGGMFFTTELSLASDDIPFRFPLDNGDSAIHGRARIVRRIDTRTAHRRAMLPGYGVSIVDIDGSARRRYTNFVTRVQRRSQRRVFVGAGDERVRELMNGLASVGYEVTGACEPSVLNDSNQLGGATVDIAVIDASLGNQTMNEFRRIFLERNVQCVSVHGDSAPITRASIDRFLAIS